MDLAGLRHSSMCIKICWLCFLPGVNNTQNYIVTHLLLPANVVDNIRCIILSNQTILKYECIFIKKINIQIYGQKPLVLTYLLLVNQKKLESGKNILTFSVILLSNSNSTSSACRNGSIHLLWGPSINDVSFVGEGGGSKNWQFRAIFKA